MTILLSICVIFCFVGCLRSESINLHNLNENPGLVPFELGEAKLFDYYRTSIHIIDLEKTKSKINVLQQRWNQFKQLNKNNRGTFDKLKEQVSLVDDKFYVAQMKLSNLLPEKSRPKRFFDKTYVTKVYNYLNNEKYDRAIEELQNQDKKIVNNLMEHISKSNMMFKDVENKLKIIEDNISKIKFELDIQGSIISFNLLIDFINEYLQDIENGVTFSRHGNTHTSIVNSTQLFNIISELNVPDENLLFPLTRSNIIKFFDIVTTRSYARTDGKIVFLISVPIMKKETYKLYQLYSIPVRKDDEFLTIIAKRSFLLQHDKGFILTNNECENFGTYFYCKEHNGFAGPDEMGCLDNIVMLNNDYKKCVFTKVSIADVFVEQVSELYYIVVSPKPETIKVQCDVRKTETISGSYLLEVPEGCSFTIDTITYMNDEMEDNKALRPVLAPKINWDLVIEPDNEPLPLNGLSLSKLQSLKNTPSSSGKYYGLIFGLIGGVILMQLGFIGFLIWKSKRDSSVTSGNTRNNTIKNDNSEENYENLSVSFKRKEEFAKLRGGSNAYIVI